MDINKIASALDIWDIVKWIFGLLVLLFGFLIIFWRAIKVFFRLGKNLGRKVFIFCPVGGKRGDGSVKNMERELGILRNSGFFDVPKEPVTDFHSIEAKDIKKAGVVILGYDRKMENFDDFIDMVKQAGKPLIIYTFELGYQLEEKHRKMIKDYKWYVLSSMPLRLVSDLFAIMASYKYEQERD